MTGWSAALPDWEVRIREGRSLIPDLPLHDAYADKALRIFSRLHVPDLVGQPTFAEICDPWVTDFVRAVFGTYDPDTRRRAIQEFFVLIPKKNGKSAIAAAIMMTAMILNLRPNAEMLLISETQHIAAITFATARGIITSDPALGDVFRIQDTLKTITNIKKNAILKVMSSDNDVITGTKASCVLIDEAHVLGMKQKAPAVYLELRGGQASRPEGFFLQITTQSKTEPAGQFKKELMKAREVRDGIRAAPLLPVLYEYPPEMAKAEAWRDQATWGMVNPNLERSVSRDFLIAQFEDAEANGPEAIALFASQHLNVEIGQGLHSERWAGADYWEACTESGLTFDALIERSEVAVIGGDIGGADDLLGIAVIGRDRDTRHWLIWAHAWCLPDVLDRRKSIAPVLTELRQMGELTISADTGSHVRDVADICDRLRDAHILPGSGAVGLDPWGVEALTDELLKRRFAEDQITGVGQGYKLTGAIKGLERRLVDRTIRHGGQRLMRWAVGNAKAEARGNNIMITKAKAGTAKIDPLVALFNAAILMGAYPTADGGTYLDSAELMVL